MSDGARELQAFIDRIESLRSMNERVAKAAEAPVLAVAKESAARGVTPSGETWAPTIDGHRALPHAADAINSRSNANAIVLSLEPPYAFHNHGAGGSSQTKGAKRERARTRKRQSETGTRSRFHAPRRQILPEPGEPLPAKMRDAIEHVAGEIFADAMGGR